MRITFQQGIITYPVVGSQQSFLKRTGVYVSVSTTNGRTDIAFAHGSSNYILTEASDVNNAWGPIPNSTDVWLYWDINTQTAVRTFGFTLLEPAYGTTRPSSPSSGQHFFHTTEKKMYVYDSGSWRNVIRVFAAKLNNTTFSPVGDGIGLRPYAGTQVGLNNIPTLVGRILIDNAAKPIRRSTGTFFTTEDDIFINGSPVNTIRLEANVLSATAQESMSEYQIAYYSDFGKINVATYDKIQDAMLVMLMESLTTGSTGTVITQGTVTNPAWGFENVGSSLWVDSSGVLVETDPHLSSPLSYPASKPPIGRVISPDTIFFDQGLGGIGPRGLPGAAAAKATNNTFGISRLTVPAADGDNPMVVGDNDPRMSDARTPLDHTHQAEDVTFTAGGDIEATDVQAAIEELDAEKVSIAGDTMTGDLTLSGAPTDDLHAATKKYVDDSISAISPELALDDLTDVDAAEPDDGDVLTYDEDAEQWVSAAIPAPSPPELALDDLTDVTIDSCSPPVDGDVLTYDNGNWINAAPEGGGGLPTVVENNNRNIFLTPTDNNTYIRTMYVPEDEYYFINIELVGDGWSVGDEVHIEQGSSSEFDFSGKNVKIYAGEEVTINILPGFYPVIMGQHGVVTLKCVGYYTWTIFGAMSTEDLPPMPA